MSNIIALLNNVSDILVACKNAKMAKCKARGERRKTGGWRGGGWTETETGAKTGRGRGRGRTERTVYGKPVFIHFKFE